MNVFFSIIFTNHFGKESWKKNPLLNVCVHIRQPMIWWYTVWQNKCVYCQRLCHTVPFIPYLFNNSRPGNEQEFLRNSVVNLYFLCFYVCMHYCNKVPWFWRFLVCWTSQKQIFLSSYLIHKQFLIWFSRKCTLQHKITYIEMRILSISPTSSCAVYTSLGKDCMSQKLN